MIRLVVYMPTHTLSLSLSLSELGHISFTQCVGGNKKRSKARMDKLRKEKIDNDDALYNNALSLSLPTPFQSDNNSHATNEDALRLSRQTTQPRPPSGIGPFDRGACRRHHLLLFLLLRLFVISPLYFILLFLFGSSHLTRT